MLADAERVHIHGTETSGPLAIILFYSVLMVVLTQFL